MHFNCASLAVSLLAQRRKIMMKTLTEINCVLIPPMAPPVSQVLAAIILPLLSEVRRPAESLSCRRQGFASSHTHCFRSRDPSFFRVQLRALDLPWGLGWSRTSEAAAVAAAALACKTELLWHELLKVKLTKLQQSDFKWTSSLFCQFISCKCTDYSWECLNSAWCENYQGPHEEKKYLRLETIG